MHKFLKGKGLAILLTLAMMIVAVAVIVPITTAADPAEIQDFQYQTLSSFTLASDEDTDIRFVFTIGKLDYTEVGFVVSKSNSTPTIGGANCYKAGTETVYSTITADDTPIPAPAGRFWVAVKLTDIPRSYFDGSLYVRAFVTDGEGTRYSDASAFTVCVAAGHLAHTIDDLAHGMKSGTAAMNVVGTKIGHCSVCNLDNVTQYGATTSLEYKKWIGGGSNDSWVDAYKISDILAGGKHFYPDASNNYEGNDLYAEYSVLWNETLLNLSPTQENGARLETQFSTKSNGSANYKALAYWSLTNNVSDSGAKIAGAFEYPCPNISTSEPGNPYPGMTAGGGAFSAYPNIGGTDPDHPEWGWHRVGVKYHQDVTNLAAVRDNGAAAQYKLTVTVYIDGQIVSILSGTSLDKSGNDYKLYTVTGGGGELNYTDINGNLYFQIFKLYNYCAPEFDAYFIDGDSLATCGQDFVHPVTRIDNPAARTEIVDGHEFNGAFYYTTVGSHDHVWGELVNDASHAADCGHAATQSIHCTVCGATKPDSTVNLPIDPSLHAYGAYTRILEPSLLNDGIDRRTCANCGANDDRAIAYEIYKKTFSSDNNEGFGDRKLLSDIMGSKHFYPTNDNPTGNDLLIEFSFLWNPTLSNFAEGTGGSNSPFVTARFSNWNGDNANVLVYWSLRDNCNDAWCKYAGGFEAGTLQTVATDDVVAGGTPAGMCAGGGNYAAYPNIGGSTPADLENLNNGHEWGWHRVQIRLHQEVSNVAAVQGGAAATYRFVCTTYFDGVPVSTLEKSGTALGEAKNYLFTAESDGEGGITYSDNAYLGGNNSNKRTIWAYKFNYTPTESENAYWEEGDIFYTCGHDFVQNVEKVASPAYVDYQIASGIHVNAAFYYKFAD